MKKISRRNKGQTILETAFVFTMLIFLTFTIVNFAILFHTKNIATYAAFMAGRSYQVLGDQSGADYFDESGGKANSKLLADLGKTVAAFRVAEDIFTCSLPWMSVPEGDGNVQLGQEDLKNNPSSRCQEGKRKYQKTNIAKALNFSPFAKDQNNPMSKKNLDSVDSGFTESGRKPLRYGVLNLKYRTPVLFNPMDVFGTNGSYVKSEVYVPILLNPGLEEGLTEDKKNEKDFDDEK